MRILVGTPGPHPGFYAGVTLLDTADAYCLDATGRGHNERLIARALSTFRL